MEKEYEPGFDELLQEVQQQFLCYQEKSNKRFQELEELMELADHKMETLKKMKVKKKGEASKSRSPGNDLLESLTPPKLNFPKFDEFPGEDKDDWHSEEIICIALGLEDSFQPKKNFEEGNSSGAKDLQCTSDFRITPTNIKSKGREEIDVTIKSRPEFLMPRDLITFTKLDGLRLQPAPCIILKGQDVNSLEDYDKEIGSSQQHSSRKIQVDYKMTSAEENKGVMQLLVGAGQAYEALKDKRDAIPGAQNHYHSESGTVGKFRRDKLEFFCVNHLTKCSHSAHKSELLLGINSERIVLVEGGHGLKDSINVIKAEGAWKRETEICTNKGSLELVEFANIQGLQQRGGNINLNNEMIPIQLGEVSSMIPTIRDIVEAFCSRKSVKDFPIDGTYDLGMRSSNFGRENVLIFDPGGQVKKKQSKGVKNKFKDVIRSEVIKEAAVVQILVANQLRDWHDISLNSLAIEQLLEERSQLQRKVHITEIENSARVQRQNVQVSDGIDIILAEIKQQNDHVRAEMIVQPYKYIVLKQGSPGKVMRFEVKEAWRRKYTIIIFDPGGKRAGIIRYPSEGKLESSRSTMRTWLF